STNWSHHPDTWQKCQPPAATPQDRVSRQFMAEHPDHLWVADFTYGVPGVQGEHGCSNEPRVCLEY
ncbi:hypothetical protein, partial [Yersinia wautersii]|uniref:hypothetical protein n=1 Tax=Yersinia wautersii TaxID=1341643 RepID=UPI0012DBD933